MVEHASLKISNKKYFNFLYLLYFNFTVPYCTVPVLDVHAIDLPTKSKRLSCRKIAQSVNSYLLSNRFVYCLTEKNHYL